MLAAFAASIGYVVNDSGPAEAKAEAPRFPVVIGSEATRLRAELDAARGELDLANAQLDRWHKIFNFSSTYRVGADLATSIYDISLAEGIEPELAPRVFRQFWRGGNSRRRGGTGLGLFIVKGLVEAHGGTIIVQRAPEGGSEFRFTMPTGTPDFA